MMTSSSSVHLSGARKERNMLQKLLLASIALVSAGSLLAGSALTQEDEKAGQEQEAAQEQGEEEAGQQQEAAQEQGEEETGQQQEAAQEQGEEETGQQQEAAQEQGEEETGQQQEEAVQQQEEEEEAQDEEEVLNVPVGTLQVVLGGTTKFGVVAGDKNTVSGERDQNYAFEMENEVFLRVDAATESGVRYGSRITLKVGSDGEDSAVVVDEASLFFSGNFGRAEFGRRSGAEDLMYVGAREAQAGTGGIDGDIPNTNFLEFENTDTAAKVTYFTPRVAGLQLGVSFAKDYPDGVVEDDEDIQGKNGIGPGANWVGTLGPLDVTLSAVGMFGECRSGCDGDEDGNGGFRSNQKSWAVGGLFGFNEFSLGAGYIRQDDFAPETQDNDIVNFGLAYGFGEANVSVGYSFNKFGDQNLDDSHLFVLSGDIGLLPGVTLLGDVAYNTNDLEACCRTEDGERVNKQSATWGGVIAVEIDY